LSSLRIELRPSLRLRWAVLVLALLAALSVWMSALPRAALLAVPALGALAFAQLQRAPRGRLHLEASGLAEWWRDGAHEPETVEALSLERRGPFAVLSWRCGDRSQRWPAASDTLPPAAARALDLWIGRQRPSTIHPPDSAQGPA
jgi:hypothetical protein